MKVKQTTFFCPFSRNFPAALPLRPSSRSIATWGANYSQSVKRKILRRLTWNWTSLQLYSAGRRGGALALMLQRNVASRVAAGTCLSVRHPASARASRRAGRRPDPDFGRLHCSSPSRSPTPSICPWAQSPAARTAGSAGSRQQTPGRITSSKKKKQKKPKTPT